MATIDRMEKALKDIESLTAFVTEEKNQSVMRGDQKRFTMAMMMEKPIVEFVQHYQSYGKYVRMVVKDESITSKP
jgi:hypothetical protein